jgi:hypothetical protein
MTSMPEEHHLGDRPMKSLFAVILTAVLASSVVASSALAHGGGLDKNGCHTNRRTGDRHCHR